MGPNGRTVPKGDCEGSQKQSQRRLPKTRRPGDKATRLATPDRPTRLTGPKGLLRNPPKESAGSKKDYPSTPPPTAHGARRGLPAIPHTQDNNTPCADKTDKWALPNPLDLSTTAEQPAPVPGLREPKKPVDSQPARPKVLALTRWAFQRHHFQANCQPKNLNPPKNRPKKASGWMKPPNLRPERVFLRHFQEVLLFSRSPGKISPRNSSESAFHPRIIQHDQSPDSDRNPDHTTTGRGTRNHR